jgi:two-component system phosphate regulon sensor histidine kinase PhoR
MLLAIIVFCLLILVGVLGVNGMLLRLRLRDAETDYNVQRLQTAKIEAEAQAIRAQMDDFPYHKALMLTLANISYDATIIVNTDLEVVAINDTAEALFPSEKPIGMTLDALTHVVELEMMVSDALINEEEEFEEQISIGDAAYRVRTRVFRRDGYHLIGLALRDITQLVKLNRARRDMVANISHELRTPIANIRLIIDGLFHDQDRPKRKDSIHSLRAVARETDNLLWLVQEMSDLSMIESGQAIVRLTDYTLVDLVDESMERMVDRAEAANITLVRHVPEKLRVLCDRDLLQRVIVNLIHNAIKWSPQGEAITINATNGGDEITISVLDNGPGVPPDAVDRIFERFYQIDASRSGGEGTGLGLAICRHIVEAHGGRIWAESNADGAGGHFRFTLLSANAGTADNELD